MTRSARLAVLPEIGRLRRRRSAAGYNQDADFKLPSLAGKRWYASATTFWLFSASKRFHSVKSAPGDLGHQTQMELYAVYGITGREYCHGIQHANASHKYSSEARGD